MSEKSQASTAVSVERASYHTRYENQTIGYASDRVEIKILGQRQRQDVAFTNHFGTIPPRLSSCLLLTTSLPITRSENHHVHIAIDGFGRTNHTCLFVSKARGPLQLSLHRSSFFFFLTLLRFSLTLLTEPTNSRAQLPSPPPSVRAIAPSPAT